MSPHSHPQPLHYVTLTPCTLSSDRLFLSSSIFTAAKLNREYKAIENIRQLTMGDRLRGPEKPVFGAEVFPLAESVLNRLNKIDLRLRQLEEKERLPEKYFAADLGGRSHQLPSYMDDVHLKEALMRMDQLGFVNRDISEIGLNEHIQSKKRRFDFVVGVGKGLQLMRIKILDKDGFIKLNP